MCSPVTAYADTELSADSIANEGMDAVESSSVGSELDGSLYISKGEDRFNDSVDDSEQGSLPDEMHADASEELGSADPGDGEEGVTRGEGSRIEGVEDESSANVGIDDKADEGTGSLGESNDCADEENCDAKDQVKQEDQEASSNTTGPSVSKPSFLQDAPNASVASSSKAVNKSEQAFEKLEDGAYMIKSALGKNVDISSAGKRNGDNVQTWSNNYSAAQRFYLQAQGRGSSGEWYYTIKNVNSGKVLDCASGGTKSGTNVQQYAANGTGAQHWYLRKTGAMYQIVNVKSGLMLDVSGARKANGANIQIYQGNNTLAQLWRLMYCAAAVEDGAHEIVSTLPGKRVLDVASASADNGAVIQTYTPNGTLAQSFSLSYEKSSGYYVVTNYGSGRVVDVAGCSNAQGAAVQQYASNGTKAQKWQIVKNQNGSFTFFSAIDGKVLDVVGGKAANGVPMQQYSANGTRAQQFTLRTVKPEAAVGTVMLRNGANTYLVADVANGSTANGAKLQLYDANYTFAQKFQIVVDKSGFYTVRMIGSGLYLTVSKSGTVSQQETGDSSKDYFWSLTPTATGHFSLSSSKLGLSLGLSGNAASGKALQGVSSKQTTSTWNMLPVQLISDGYYTVASLNNAGLVLDVSGASLKYGANVRLWSQNGTNAQKFYISHVGSGQYAVSNAWSSLRLDVKNGVAAVGSNIQQYGSNGTKSQKWKIDWDEAGGFVFKSTLGSFSMGSSSNPANGSNVYLKKIERC